MRGSPVDRDFFDTIDRRIRALDRQIVELENDSRPTVPFYDSANWPTNAVEGQLVIAPRLTAHVCDLGSYVARVGQGGFLRAYDPASDDDDITLTEFYATIDVVFPSTGLAFWNIHSDSGGIIGTPGRSSIGEAFFGLRKISDGSLNWVKCDTSGALTDNVLTSAHVEPDTCHHIGIHVTLSQVDVYIDGDIFTDVYPSWSTVPLYGSDIRVGGVGRNFGGTDPAEEFFFDNFKLGTTGWDSSNRQSDDFETGTIDFTTKWWTNSFPYPITIVAAPF